MGIVDIIIIVAFVLFILIGIIKGMFKQLLGTCALFVAMILAFLLCKPVSAKLYTADLGQNITNSITTWVEKKGEIFTQNISESNDEMISDALSEVGIPKFLHKVIINEAVDQIDSMNLGEYIGTKLAHLALVCISYIALFIILFIVLKILSVILGKVLHKIPVVAMLDRILGGVMGFVKAFVVVSVAMILLSFLASVISSVNDFVVSDMRLNEEGFRLAKFFYANNPLLIILSKYIKI